MNTLKSFLISTLLLAGLSLNLAEAAVPPGKSITPSIALQGGSTSNVKWAAPGTSSYKVHVFVPSTGKETNALYRVYPKGKRAGSTACLATDKLFPCFAVTIDQNQHRNAWVQLTLNGDPETQWAFTKTRGYVAAVADNLGSETLLNVSTQIRLENMSIAIGKTYQGGIIFHVDGSGAHGLIAAPQDQGTGIVWWNGSFVTTGATATAVGTGQANTDKIIAAQGAGDYAATLTANLVLNGYSDWFLPSKDALNLMYKNIGPGAPAPLTNIGGFSSAFYWSSSEFNVNNAWSQRFGDGAQGTNPKSSTSSVRAVRAF
jgi:hypothetical protein